MKGFFDDLTFQARKKVSKTVRSFSRFIVIILCIFILGLAGVGAYSLKDYVLNPNQPFDIQKLGYRAEETISTPIPKNTEDKVEKTENIQKNTDFVLTYKERGYIITNSKLPFYKDKDSIEYKKDKLITIEECMLLTLYYRDTGRNLGEITKILKEFSNKNNVSITSLLGNNKPKGSFIIEDKDNEKVLKDILDLLTL